MAEVKKNSTDVKAHINERLDSLMAKVDLGFGVMLIDQLTQRINLTAREYSLELESMIDRLQRNAETNEELLDRIRKRYENADESAPGVPDEEDDGVTEWERRLAQLEGPSN